MLWTDYSNSTNKFDLRIVPGTMTDTVIAVTDSAIAAHKTPFTSWVDQKFRKSSISFTYHNPDR